jgi:ABC-type sugar transport system substrate-binding protein
MAWVICAVALFSAGCSKQSTPAQTGGQGAPAGGQGAAAAGDKKLVIGVMPKLVGIDYFNACEQGAREAGRELGVEVVYDGPATNDVTKQAQMVETWVTKKYDAIAIAPNDPDAIGVALDKARKRGIKVITWDADAVAGARDFFVNQAANSAVASSLMDLMAKEVGPEAKYIIVTGSLTAANQNIWMAEMEKYRAATYPGMTNLSATPKASEEDSALATTLTLECLKTYPDLQGIFAITSTGLPGAAEAIRKAGAADRIFLTGLATPKQMRSYVKDGTVRKFVLWSPVDLGYLSVYAAVAAVRGELKPGDASFNAGRLGTVQIEGDQILLGDPLVFDINNIDNYNF